MAKGEIVKVGDLIMWVGRNGIRYFGKVISFTYYGRPIARKIKEAGIVYDYKKDLREMKPLRYGIGREVPDNWTVIATMDADTIDQVHPITKARINYEVLEGTRRYLF